MGRGSCMRIGVRVLEVGGICRKGSIAYALHLASQCFPAVQYVVADVLAFPDTRYVHGVRSSSVAGLFGFSVTGLGINAVELLGVACEERVAAAAACCACTWRTEMERCCAGAAGGVHH